MDENIRRFLGWTAVVLMTVTAMGSFLVRYAGFTRLLDNMESVSLSDSLVKEVERQTPSSPALVLFGSLDSRLPFRATREGLVRECGGGELIGVLMLAGEDGILDEAIDVDGVPCGRVDLAGIRKENRYRVVVDVDETGVVISSGYVKLP